MAEMKASFSWHAVRPNGSTRRERKGNLAPHASSPLRSPPLPGLSAASPSPSPPRFSPPTRVIDQIAVRRKRPGVVVAAASSAAWPDELHVRGRYLHGFCFDKAKGSTCPKFLSVLV